MTASSASGWLQSNGKSATAPLPRVFLLTNSLETGGSERQFVTLAGALDKNAFSLSLGCLKRVGPFVHQVADIAEFSPGGSLFKWPSHRARIRMARHLRALKVAVAHAFDFYSNLMLIPAARLAGVPVVIGSHRQIGDLLTNRQFFAQKIAFGFCDHIVCNSNAAAQNLRGAGVTPEKLVVIPNGIQEEFFAGAKSAWPHEPGIVRIGMISRMNDKVKQHDLFLRVAAQLTERFPRARFVLIGDGPLRPGLERLAESLHLGDRVSFVGDRQDIPAVLAGLHISVLPSLSESLSNVIVESMVAGLPVVASRAGGNPEVVQDGETGLLFDSGDEVQFAAALEKLLNRPELRNTLGLRARERASALYRMAAVRDQFQELYRTTLVRKGWSLPELVAPWQAVENL